LPCMPRLCPYKTKPLCLPPPSSPVHVPHLSNPNWSSPSRIELAAPPQALAALLSLEFAAASHHRRSRSAADYRVKEADAIPSSCTSSSFVPHCW
jgi:hypothetical protein